MSEKLQLKIKYVCPGVINLPLTTSNCISYVEMIINFWALVATQDHMTSDLLTIKQGGLRALV